MQLEGSCHCQSVRFSVQSIHPYPFNICFCSICRKTAGSGGFAINLSADANTLVVQGEDHLGIYQARSKSSLGQPDDVSPAQRKFCRQCGSHLWVWDPRWPDLVHPHAGAIDTELPIPPEYTYLMVGSKAAWVPVPASGTDQVFDEYPTESIAEWHQRLGLTS
ncbi:MAG: GFA family protein [Rhodospirillales bacterium]|nr:GFA family protein [Rhodospirillales bacterium]